MPAAIQKTRIRDLLVRTEPLPEVIVKGWVRTLRKGKEVAFAALSDGSCLAVLATLDSDIGLVGYEMAMLVARCGDVLTPALTVPVPVAAGLAGGVGVPPRCRHAPEGSGAGAPARALPSPP